MEHLVEKRQLDFHLAQIMKIGNGQPDFIYTQELSPRLGYKVLGFNQSINFTLLSLKKICIVQLMITSKIYGMVTRKMQVNFLSMLMIS